MKVENNDSLPTNALVTALITFLKITMHDTSIAFHGIPVASQSFHRCYQWASPASQLLTT